MKKLKIVTIVLDILCVILNLAAAIFNFSYDNTKVGWLYTFCAICWIVCAVINIYLLHKNKN